MQAPMQGTTPLSPPQGSFGEKAAAGVAGAAHSRRVAGLGQVTLRRSPALSAVAPLARTLSRSAQQIKTLMPREGVMFTQGHTTGDPGERRSLAHQEHLTASGTASFLQDGRVRDGC
ncbi:uncharacterized protein WM277_023059 isoform 1-T1 [Molossus nigricans]